MDIDKLKSDLETFKSELHVCKRKLDSKCEALLILSKDLDQCRQERDQFKLMAEQVQSRYLSIKRQLAGVGPRLSSLDGVDYSDMKHQSLAQLLCEMRDVNKSLQFEVDDLKQKLKDSNGDIKLLREQIARHRVGTTDEGMDTRHFPAYEREDLVHQLESVRSQYQQLERDIQQVVDEKEELVNERDVYRLKYDRLNKELHYILKGDERRVLDVDALITENRYLQERIRQAEDEQSHAMATITKYKNILEKKKSKGILKLGQNRSGGVVISQKQVHQLLEDNTCLTPTPQMMADLQSLSCALLESLNDKNLALLHQRKTNKILGTRISELEKKLKTLEMTCAGSGSSQHVEGAPPNSLEKLRLECLDLKSQVDESATVAGSQCDDEELSVDRRDSQCFADLGQTPTSPRSDAGGLESTLNLIDCSSSLTSDGVQRANVTSSQSKRVAMALDRILVELSLDEAQLHCGADTEIALSNGLDATSCKDIDSASSLGDSPVAKSTTSRAIHADDGDEVLSMCGSPDNRTCRITNSNGCDAAASIQIGNSDGVSPVANGTDKV